MLQAKMSYRAILIENNVLLPGKNDTFSLWKDNLVYDKIFPH